MRTQLGKRLQDLESRCRKVVRRGYVWARHDQSNEEALAAAGNPEGVEIFRWKAPQ